MLKQKIDLVNNDVITTESDRKIFKREISKTFFNNNILNELIKLQEPNVDRERCCLHQLAILIKVDESSPVFGFTTAYVLKILKPKFIGISESTFHRNLDQHDDHRILPKKTCELFSSGRLPLLNPEDLVELKQVLRENVGKCSPTRSSDDIQKKQEEKGTEATNNSPCRKIMKKYHNMLVFSDNEEEEKNDSEKSQNRRRKTATTSVKNVIAQICTLILTQFVPESHNTPKNISTGHMLAHSEEEK